MRKTLFFRFILVFVLYPSLIFASDKPIYDDRSIEHLMRVIKEDSDIGVKSEAILSLGKRQCGRAVRLLLECYAESALKDDIIYAFQKMGKEAEPLFDIALKDDDPRIRAYAVAILAYLHLYRTDHILIRALSDKDPQVTKTAAYALFFAIAEHKVQIENVLPPMLQAVLDQRLDKKDISKIIQKLGKEAESKMVDLIQGTDDKTFELLLEIFPAVGTDAIFPLVKHLGTMDRRTRLRTALILKNFGKPAVDYLNLLSKVKVIEFHADVRNLDVLVGAIYALETIKDPGSIDALIQFSFSSDYQRIRGAAIEALASYGETAIPALIKSLSIPTSEGISPAVCALAKIGKKASPALIAELKSSDPNVKMHAAEALGLIGEKEAVPQLIDLLSDGGHPTKAAIIALARIGDPEAILPLIKAFKTTPCSWETNVIREAFIEFGEVSIDPLIDALNESASITFVRAVIYVFRFIGNRRAMEALVEGYLTAKFTLNRSEQAELFETLTQFNDPTVSSLIISAVKENRVKISSGEVQILFDYFKDPNLLEVLNSQYFEDMNWIYPARDRILSPNNLERWSSGLSKEGIPPATRAHIIRGLGFSDVRIYPKAMDILITALTDSEESIRAVAAEAVLRIGEPATPHLLRKLQDENPELVLKIGGLLCKISGSWRRALVSALKSQDRQTRKNAAMIFGHLKDPMIISDLIALLMDPEEMVREEAYRALMSMGKEDVLELLFTMTDNCDPHVANAAGASLLHFRDRSVPFLIQKLSDQNHKIRFKAQRLIVKMGEGAVYFLIEELKNEDRMIRRTCCFLLGILGDSRSYMPLLRATVDEDPGVRAVAREALTQIGIEKVDSLGVVEKQR